MLNLLMVVSFTFVAPAATTAPAPEALVVTQARLVDGGPQQAPAAPSDDVTRAYDALRSVRGRERTQILAQLPSATKSGVWAHHLLTMLVKHPEFTAEQRAVIQEALALLNPELFEIDPSSPRWADMVDLPLRRLKERAIAAFGDTAIARDIFTQVGTDSELSNVNDQGAAPAVGTGQPPAGRSIKTDSENCICSVASDWCYTGYQCLNTWCNFTGAGCGTLLLYPCEGLCFMKPHA
jgi:hypothetical protein